MSTYAYVVYFRDISYQMPVIYLDSQGVNAMQFLQRAKNIGKVVISFLGLHWVPDRLVVHLLGAVTSFAQVLGRQAIHLKCPPFGSKTNSPPFVAFFLTPDSNRCCFVVFSNTTNCFSSPKKTCFVIL